MTAAYLGATLVAVLVNGILVPSVPTATLAGGRVVGPPQLIAHFASRVSAIDGNRIEVERNGRHCSAPVRRGDDAGRVALAPLVRCLGGASFWDGRARTLSIVFGAHNGLATPAPFDPRAPQVAPTTVFTPEPAPPTPRAIDSGIPSPRRTAIPVVPSWPLPTTRPRR